jgi:hypothetical protein
MLLCGHVSAVTSITSVLTTLEGDDVDAVATVSDDGCADVKNPYATA